MARLHGLVLPLVVLLGVVAGARPLPAGPATPGELGELVVDLASSRSLAWTTMALELGTGNRARLDLTAPARLHQFAPIMALAAGPAEVMRRDGVRTLTMEVQLDAPPAPVPADEMVTTLLSALAADEGVTATLILAPRAESFTTLSVEATLPATSPAGTWVRTLAGWEGAHALTVEHAPDGTRHLRLEARLPLLPVASGDATGMESPDWTLAPSEGGTALRLTAPLLPRAGGAHAAGRVVDRAGDRLRLLSVTLRPDGAALSASLAPASGPVEGP